MKSTIDLETSEIRKDIVGKDGEYQISNMGNVKGFKGYMHPTLDSGGYLKVNFRTDRENIKSIRIHRLVAEHFVEGQQPGLEVNHKNTNRFDCRAENLEWVTKSENSKHSFLMGRKHSRKGVFGINNSTSKPVNQYNMNGDFIAKRDSINEAAEGTGARASCICMCCKGHPNHRSSGGFKWEYAEKPHLQAEEAEIQRCKKCGNCIKRDYDDEYCCECGEKRVK